MGYSIDGNTKVISLTSGTTEVSVRDLWSRWVDWYLTSDNSKYLPAFTNVGGNDIDTVAGTSIPIYVFMQNGWKIKPQEANHTLVINDGILLVEGGGDPFNNTTGSYIVRINYQQPVQAITVATGGSTGGGLTAAQALQLLELWKIMGLDVSNPLEVTPSIRTAGDIDQTITQISANDVIVQRI